MYTTRSLDPLLLLAWHLCRAELLWLCGPAPLHFQRSCRSIKVAETGAPEEKNRRAKVHGGWYILCISIYDYIYIYMEYSMVYYLL